MPHKGLHRNCYIGTLLRSSIMLRNMYVAQSAGAVEYSDCASAKG